MEWWQLLLITIGLLFLLMAIRVPVAFAFLLINIIGALYLWGGGIGLQQLLANVREALTSFSIAPIPLFILMGEIMFHTGIAPRVIDTIDKWIGRVPGRLSFLAVGGGTMLSTLSGSSIACTAILGSTLLPEMKNRGYKDSMTIGPILGSGGLAVLIPPSALGVLLASIGKISIGSFLIAIIVPGVTLALFFMIYIFIRAKLQPHLAPAYDTENISLSEKLLATAKYILPLGFIIFLVIGLIFLGVATPTEAAALGVVGSAILAAIYGQLNVSNIKVSLIGTMKITTMIFILIAGSTTFSELLSFSGVTRELVSIVSGLQSPPIIIILVMIAMLIIMGTFMDGISIMMITLPIFIPIVSLLDYNLIWFAVIVLITIEIGQISPPFGMGLFTMKGVAPKDVSMKSIYKASFPFIGIDILLIAVIILFPALVTWLPSLMN
ncbi:TRAP transporter large permease [Sporosarcina obsidiansis]|uniref:TRAP transporter large permease n=1 Tax=Sporosarcina obsidiansis TaxID=2660748 RepID=UPI00129C0C1A|nr:TRAP transporter large permease subunit [Sporosarcina obsidiansis]